MNREQIKLDLTFLVLDTAFLSVDLVKISRKAKPVGSMADCCKGSLSRITSVGETSDLEGIQEMRFFM
jgi:hypothetical protein